MQTCKNETSKPRPSAMCAGNRRATRSAATASTSKPTRSRLLTWPLEETQKSTRCSRSTSHFRRMALVAICQTSPSCHKVNVRQIPSAPPGSTSEAQTEGLIASLQCIASRDGAAPTWDVECFDVTKAYWHTPWPEQQNGPLFLLPPHPLHPTRVEIATSWIGLEKAHHVILGGRRDQQLWQEHFNKFGFVTCTAAPTLNVHRESITVTSLNNNCDSHHKHVSKTPAIKATEMTLTHF